MYAPAGQECLPQLCTRTCAPVPATLACQNPRESAHADSHTHAARFNRVLLFELYRAQKLCVTRCNSCEQSAPAGCQLASSGESSTLNSVPVRRAVKCARARCSLHIARFRIFCTLRVVYTVVRCNERDTRSRCRCGPVPVQVWASPGADVVSVPSQIWVAHLLE